MLHGCATSGVDAEGGEAVASENRGEGDIEVIAPLPAEALVRRSLIDDREITEPMVVPMRIRLSGVDGGVVDIENSAPAGIGDERCVQRSRRGAPRECRGEYQENAGDNATHAEVYYRR